MVPSLVLLILFFLLGLIFIALPVELDFEDGEEIDW